MAAELVYVVASMALLGIVTLGVSWTELGVPGVVCWVAVLPMVAVGSAVALWLQAALDLHLYSVPAGVGVVVLAIGGVSAAAD